MTATPTVSDVVACMQHLYPPSWAADWDSVGLICGDPHAPVQRVLFALDPVETVAQQAFQAEAQMIITHHPLYLRGTSSVAATTPKGRLAHRLITGGVALFNAHTNADVAIGGVNDALADLLQLHDRRPLQREYPDAPAPVGLGRIGLLPAPVSLREFAATVAQVLPSSSAGIRVSGDLQQSVQKVAVCGGAGDSLLAEVAALGAEVYVTADLRHHPASEAAGDSDQPGPALIDAGHWATEWPWLPVAAQALREHLDGQGFLLDTTVSPTPTDPWALHLPTQLPTAVGG